MGIPRLFKVLSERYPNLSQLVPANQLPQYDYLHIDMNNLIHKALSERSLLPLEQLDDEFYVEERVFERIFCYVETLHRIIPTKVLFLSIDGVAPRAKWATQRERRLRENALQSQFDSNAVSPGTKFMINLETALMEYLTNKAKHHSNWQNCEVFVSGSSCPGEGSIKIIDFIRSLKNTKGFVPNQSHCIYSGDNDYLLLGIATHELYISLIHEKQKSAGALAALCLNDTKHQFEVTHFETLRQYLRMEFMECQQKMTFEFDMDHISDDWVVLISLLGNDYVPGLPNFNVDHNALTMIYDAYKTVLTASNGYINEFGMLNVRRFARLMTNLKPHDFDMYRNSQKKAIEAISKEVSAVNLNNNNNVDDPKSEPRFSDFMEMKDQYYTQQLGSANLPNFEQMSVRYVNMIQWTLFYYYRGTCSWNEYYPFDCVPFVSDLVDIHKTTISLEFGKPVSIFTHLLAILPTRSSHLLPESYQMEMFDDLKVPRWEDLMEKTKRAESKLLPEEMEQNFDRLMVKLQFVGTEKSASSVEKTNIEIEKAENPYTLVYRPFNREDFNFQFSTLNLHDYSPKFDAPSITKPYSRWVISLNANHSYADATAASEKLMNKVVYINWPHYTEAKVVQIFDATKKIWQANGVTKCTENPPEFHVCVDQLKARYSECGLDVGPIEMVAYVALLKWVEYKPSESKPHTYELVKHWDDKKWEPVAIQTLIQSCMPERGEQFKLAKDVIRKTVVLLSNNSKYYGEVATVADAQSLEGNGRVNIMVYVDQSPNFEKVIRIHTAAKKSAFNEFKQPNTAATLLGITEKVFARVTGAVLVANDDDPVCMRKVNIGLQLKVRGFYRSDIAVLPDFVKQNGKQLIYSQSAIDLVQQYMDKFPRVFELLNSSGLSTIRLSELQNGKQSGLEQLKEIRDWLQSLPQSKAKRTSLETMQLSANAVKHVQFAVHTTHGADANVSKLKVKWQNLYNPDLNNVFVVPSPNATYKLLDRVMIVRSGYPVSVGTKGTVIAIEPNHNYVPGTEITESELYALDILMDHPFKLPLNSSEYKRHKIFRTRSTNMLVNISFGRAV